MLAILTCQRLVCLSHDESCPSKLESHLAQMNMEESHDKSRDQVFEDFLRCKLVASLPMSVKEEGLSSLAGDQFKGAMLGAVAGGDSIVGLDSDSTAEDLSKKLPVSGGFESPRHK